MYPYCLVYNRYSNKHSLIEKGCQPALGQLRPNLMVDLPVALSLKTKTKRKTFFLRRAQLKVAHVGTEPATSVLLAPHSNQLS